MNLLFMERTERLLIRTIIVMICVSIKLRNIKDLKIGKKSKSAPENKFRC